MLGQVYYERLFRRVREILTSQIVVVVKEKTTRGMQLTSQLLSAQTLRTFFGNIAENK